MSQASKVGVPSMLGVMSVGLPPLASTTQTSPPVDPWSDIRPPMKAMRLPSGEKRGTAICRPCRAVEVVLGSKATSGVGVAGGGDGVELGDPPVVLAGGIGGGEGDLLGVGGVAELVGVQGGGGDPGALAGGGVDRVDALDLDAVLADDAGPGLHGGERAGVAGGVLDEEEGEGLAVGGPGELVEDAGEVGELLGSRRWRRSRGRSGAGRGGSPSRSRRCRCWCRRGSWSRATRRARCWSSCRRLVGEMILSFGGVGDGGQVEGGAVVVAEGPGDGGAVGGEGDGAGGVGVGGLGVEGDEAGIVGGERLDGGRHAALGEGADGPGAGSHEGAESCRGEEGGHAKK